MTDLPYGQLRSEIDSNLAKTYHRKKAKLPALRQKRIKRCSSLLSHCCASTGTVIRKTRHFRTPGDVSTRPPAMGMDNCMDRDYTIAILQDPHVRPEGNEHIGKV